MSEVKHNATKKDHEHGNMRSYVIGFILSLVFTLIPYYLVVNQTITGTGLWLAILGFAVLQMIIQITFFLHIGRGPKPNWNLFFFVSTAGIIIFVVGASILIMNRLHYNMSPADQTKKILNDEGIYQIGGELTGACQQLYDNHMIIIKNNRATPVHTLANKCDTLTFINESGNELEIRFGSYPDQGNYAGETELSVRAGRGETITLSDPGIFQFYNNLQPETIGFFTVNP